MKNICELGENIARKFEKYGLCFRPVEVNDAQYVLDLRSDPLLGKYLSKVDESLEGQMRWITGYKEREKSGQEYYFVVQDNLANKFGLYRIYNFDGDCFEGGSWVFGKGVPAGAPILGDLAVRDIGFEQLQFKYCNLLVRQENKSVLQYHMSFKPQVVREDTQNIYLRLSYDNYKHRRDQLVRLLHKG